MKHDEPPWTTGDEPVGQLSPQDWMTDPATLAVVAALTADGAEVRFVGGCVRDAVLNRPIRDIDIATHDPPERVMLLLERAGLKAVPTGIEHGTVTAVVGRAHFEITTLRADVETFGRHARVEFTNDWAVDAARRDFTINALFCSPDGRIFDPFDGLADLGAGRVRFVGDAGKRIDEDLLRLLRFFRFHAHYGRPPADVAALAACRARAHKLPTLSGERISGEIFKLLQAPDPAAALLLMQGQRVLPNLLPEAREFGRLRVLAFLENRGVVHPMVRPDMMRRLAAVLAVDGAGARAVAERLKLSGRQCDRLLAIAAPAELPDPGFDAPAARRQLYHLGDPARFTDLVLLAWAGRKAHSGLTPAEETTRWIGHLDLAAAWTPPVMPVRGQDVLDLGIPRGPRIGALLAEMERWWIAGDFSAPRSQALERLKTLVATLN